MNKHARMMERVFNHGENLRSIFGITNIGPVELAKKLHAIEAKAHRLATDECNGVAVPEKWEEKTLRTLDKLLGFTEKQIPVFINGDPRGYTLKIDDEYVRAHDLSIHRNFGGYGILAPEFEGGITMAYTRKTVDEFQIHGNYGQGWEEVCSETTRKEARARLKEYRENEPRYPHKLVVKRIRKEAAHA